MTVPSNSALARLGELARRHALALWLLCIAVAATITLRTHYIADLSAFLPSAPTPEQAVLLDQLRSGVAARLVLIGPDHMIHFNGERFLGPYPDVMADRKC